jgi:hypothetical protein
MTTFLTARPEVIVVGQVDAYGAVLAWSDNRAAILQSETCQCVGDMRISLRRFRSSSLVRSKIGNLMCS